MSWDMDSDSDTEMNDLVQLSEALRYESQPASAAVSQGSGASTVSDSSGGERSRIESALAINKLLDEKYKKLETVLAERLRECRRKLAELRAGVALCDRFDRQEHYGFKRCGKPYFKDHNNFPAPENEDTIIMAKSGMYDFSQVTSVAGWTVKDKSVFCSLLHKMSQDIRKKELNSKIAQLKRECKLKDSKQLEIGINALKKEISGLSKKSLSEIALPIDREYDWDTVAVKLDCRHNASEYRALWKLFLHPSICKSSWTKEEHTKLQNVAQKHSFQDWDEIAKELNTGRTGYQCFVYYRTNMSNSYSGKKWTKEEEEYLKRLVEYYKGDGFIPWGKVAAAMENRTKIQIYNKYNRLLEKRKGRFVPEEDAVILTCVDSFGNNYRKIKEYLPGRSAIQIRERHKVLARKRISNVWTIHEDKKLINMMANQDSTCNFAKLCRYFPGKTREALRTRYITLCKWMKKNPNDDISKAPRRGARRLCRGSASDNLNKAMDALKTRIETEVDKKKSNRITQDSPEDAIEDAIIANLVNETHKEEDNNITNDQEQEMVVQLQTAVISPNTVNVNNLRRLLIALKAKLNKEKFQQSSYCKEYPGLLEPQQDVKIVPLKTYSKKKEEAKPAQLDDNVDIWGSNTLRTLEYVLPPHYATITGCRKLLEYSNSKDIDDSTINMARVRRNCMLKEHLFILMERFNALFLWPMLLSNAGPKSIESTSPNSFRTLNTGDSANDSSENED